MAAPSTPQGEGRTGSRRARARPGVPDSRTRTLSPAQQRVAEALAAMLIADYRRHPELGEPEGAPPPDPRSAA